MLCQWQLPSDRWSCSGADRGADTAFVSHDHHDVNFGDEYRILMAQLQERERECVCEINFPRLDFGAKPPTIRSSTGGSSRTRSGSSTGSFMLH